MSIEEPVQHSKRRALRRWAIASCVVLAVPLAFYGWFEFQPKAIAERYKLSAGHANSLKHAGASSAVYSGLRTMGFATESAVALTLRLGLWNEFGETIFKRGRPDTTREMMRDMHNNMVGISLAKWKETSRDQRDRTELLVVLAKDGVLLRSNELMPAAKTTGLNFDNGADLAAAQAWFERNQTVISYETERVLTATRSSSLEIK